MLSTKEIPENTPKFLILEFFLIFFTIVTLPVYFLILQPWKIWKFRNHIWATHIKEGDPHSPVKRVNRNSVSPMKGIFTIDKLFRIAVDKHGIKKCHGVRNVIKESEESDGTGKVLRKLQLGDYQWYSYMETGGIVKDLSFGFLSLGVKAKEPVAIFAETRREWFLALQACARINVPVVTLYATLGEDGITHGIVETEVSMIITSQKLLPKLQKIADKVPAVKQIIYMEDEKQANVSGFPANISVFKFSEVEKRGKNWTGEVKYQSPTPDDLAIIMYTSGSTGTPKGVLITHRNVMSSLDAFTDPLAEFNETDIAIGYLPLAHIYELLVECLFFSLGVKVGYSSPFTLTDKSTGLMKGCKSDIVLLQPTILCGVPLMLDRMRKSINEAVAAKGPFSSALFRYALKYKEFWWKKGFRCPITNWLLFRNVHSILGGRVKYMICGGAHLSLDTELFIRVCFDVKLTPVYAATETTGSGTVTSTKDVNAGHIGAPVPGCYMKLVDWDEGGYKVSDNPHPRGEIAISGDSVSLGYFKNKVLTEEVYKNEDGYRWFYTGDIGELLPNGTFKIIDRKKDLQKLQRGEYVSLGKTEAEMKTSVLVDNICVVGSNAHDYVVALVVPNESQLRKLAMEMGKEDLILQKLCQEKDLVKRFTDLFKENGKKNGLQNQEIPQKVTLCCEEWLPDTGLVTAALKIRRKQIEKFYKDAIDKMFETNR